jgi:hypothetical protein
MTVTDLPLDCLTKLIEGAARRLLSYIQMAKQLRQSLAVGNPIEPAKGQTAGAFPVLRFPLMFVPKAW